MKNEVFGQKVCAGGLTRKDIALPDMPEKIIEYKINKTAIISKRGRSNADAPESFIFTVNSIEFGTWCMLNNKWVKARIHKAFS